MSRPWGWSPLPSRPPSRWPNGAKVALWVAVGVESYRPDDGRTEDILPRGPAPDLVNAAWRDYGNRVGAFRLLDRLAGLGLRPALLLNSDVCDEAPEVVAAARAVGAEIIAHGRCNSDALPDMTAAQERAYVADCRNRIAAATGAAPRGWSSPWLQHRDTTLTHLRAAGFDHVLDFRLDDQPVWLATAAGTILSIPYAAELNDSTAMIGRQTDAAAFARMIADEFEEMDGWGEQAVVMSVVLHSFITGQPFRLRPVAEALGRIAASGRSWLATPGEVHAAVLEDPRRAAPQSQLR